MWQDSSVRMRVPSTVLSSPSEEPMHIRSCTRLDLWFIRSLNDLRSVVKWLQPKYLRLSYQEHRKPYCAALSLEGLNATTVIVNLKTLAHRAKMEGTLTVHEPTKRLVLHLFASGPFFPIRGGLRELVLVAIPDPKHPGVSNLLQYLRTLVPLLLEVAITVVCVEDYYSTLTPITANQMAAQFQHPRVEFCTQGEHHQALSPSQWEMEMELPRGYA
jgi:hypothetical protein